MVVSFTTCLLLDFFVLIIVQINESLYDNIVKSINMDYEGRQKNIRQGITPVNNDYSTDYERKPLLIHWNGKKLLVINGEPRRKTRCLWNALLRIMLGETRR